MRLRILLLGGLVALGAACSLNPQPLPPDKPVDGGANVDANWLGGGNDASEEDSGTTSVPSDAGVDSSFEDAGDAAEDADARSDDGSSDASFDASDDGDGG